MGIQSQKLSTSVELCSEPPLTAFHIIEEAAHELKSGISPSVRLAYEHPLTMSPLKISA